MHEFEKGIADRYDLGVQSVHAYKDAWILQTVNRKYILHKSSLSPERVEFIHAAKEHLHHNGFTHLDRYICNSEELPYTITEDGLYVVSDFVEGSECNFESRGDVIQATRLLAEMHRASQGFVPPGVSMVRSDLGKIPLFFTKRLDEMKKLKKVARRGKSRFDYLFLGNVDYFYEVGENALGQLHASRYEELVRQTKNDGVFCHHDFTHHNIVHGDQGYYLINFDFVCLELKVYDIANLIRRKMRKCKWDIREAEVILNTYQAIEKISPDEFDVMRIMIQFPQKFWRVINKYYNSKRSWSEKSFVTRLQEVIDEVEYHKQFMGNFDSLK